MVVSTLDHNLIKSKNKNDSRKQKWECSRHRRDSFEASGLPASNCPQIAPNLDSRSPNFAGNPSCQRHGHTYSSLSGFASVTAWYSKKFCMYVQGAVQLEHRRVNSFGTPDRRQRLGMKTIHILCYEPRDNIRVLQGRESIMGRVG